MKLPKYIFNVMLPMPVFKSEMRAANRAGLKSQTRRVIKPQIEWEEDIFQRRKSGVIDQFTYSEFIERCPYGEVGDYCYMREPLIRHGKFARYKDDDAPVLSLMTGELLEWRWKSDVLTSIFMPKEAARSVNRYTGIRVEHVQDISEEDAWAEGCPRDTQFLPSEWFSPLWDLINAERGYSWESNPWVWVLEYKPVGNEINGRHADLIIIDDPFNDAAAGSEALKALDFFTGDLMGGKRINTIGPVRFDPNEKGGA